jgi:hypothetical protein
MLLLLNCGKFYSWFFGYKCKVVFTLWHFDVFISRNGFIITLVITSTYTTVGYNDYDIS